MDIWLVFFVETIYFNIGTYLYILIFKYTFELIKFKHYKSVRYKQDNINIMSG